MNREELVHTIALTLVPGIGVVWARNLIEAMGSATDVFLRRKEVTKQMPGVSSRVVEALNCPEALARAEKEVAFVEKNNIRCLTIHDDDYPTRLRECDDAPVVLFFKGTINFNADKVVSIVGTRSITEYGKQMTAQFLKDLKTLCPDVLVISGLAYGVDIHAHRSALDNGLPTVGVLAHGLDRIYPATHRKTAIEMLPCGGLLTEYLTGTTPDRFNFVSRNRIVAGLADATVVMESAAKGGSLITADIAGSYHRDCFAFPGRATDDSSCGCNQLIRDNKATLIQSAADFVGSMNWGVIRKTRKAAPLQRTFFPNLSEDQQRIVDVLQKKGSEQINNLVVETDIPIYKMNSLLFELEMKGVIRVLAGGVYQLV
ncbi:DNA-processing protein DprA [Bacteroides sp. OttesenSCG-928-J23]|nr:DNA-processing protein DprA [Bacteroides sp. OttesenSCG-928-N06]MDL2247815.1 DNA-processing protein DprA [Bacteroides sp. OttesenSCG-928-J23]